MTATSVQQEDQNYLKQVREQYENYPYPPVNPEREYEMAWIPMTEGFDRLNYFCFGGRRNFNKNFRALVAGAGTGDSVIALAEQLRGTGNNVVYLDMSEASMEVAKKRADIRGLTNIEWIRDSLLNIPKLGLGQFDYINCAGVLHHLADPDAGLAILSDSLDENGSIGLMVYAKYGRMAVYLMQETLRMLNRDEPNLQRQVDNAKVLLNNLPFTNWLFDSSKMILNEIRLGGDVGIYDLLLHTQDRAYTIPELYDFTKKAGLKITQIFSDYQNISHQIYNPAFYLYDEKLIQKVEKMPLEKQRALAELLHSKIEKHTIYAAKRPTPLPSVDDLDMIPYLSFNVTLEDHEAIAILIEQSGSIVELNQQATSTRFMFPKGPDLGAIWSQIDNRKTLREIYRNVMDRSKTKGANFQTLATQFKPVYEALNRVSWMFLRHKSSSPIVYHQEMQSRIPPKVQA